ncbi:MAG: DUF6512 family protein [Candidatus Kerfeldbacteria bacterium]
MKKDKTILKWEIAGALVLILGGTLLHFTYAWSDYSPIVGLFSAVNESVWEHLKLAFAPFLLFSVVEYWFIRKTAKNVLLAKGIGILALQLFIVAFFYTYTAFTGTDILWVDIVSYFLACIVGQFVSYKLITAKAVSSLFGVVGFVIIVVHAGLLFYFTFFPPQYSIFEEESSGRYGTTWDYHPEESDDHDH